MKKKPRLSLGQSRGKKRRTFPLKLAKRTFATPTPVKNKAKQSVECTPNKDFSIKKSSENKKRKDICSTPFSKTPKKTRTDDDNGDDDLWEFLNYDHDEDKVKYFTDASTQTFPENDESLGCQPLETANESNFWERVLNTYGLKQQFVKFFNLLDDGKYPLDNIALVLFLETVKFYGLSNTSGMSYSDESKRFWKTGYRLFHGKFLYFMGGPKNLGNAYDGNQTGNCNPQDARINFAVPSFNVIRNFQICEIALPKRIPTGVIPQILDTISKSDNQRKYMLCADGKKVTVGIDKLGGDVDMFGYEDGHTLTQKQRRLELELKTFNDLILDIKDGVIDLSNTDQCDVTVEKLQHFCTIISTRIHEARDLKKRQKYGLNKFISLGGEKWRESKYVYVISALQTSIYQINEYITSALNVIRGLCKCVSCLKSSISNITDCREVDFSYQENMLHLKPANENKDLESRFIKQRSEQWFDIRATAAVTGSGLHNALGFRGLKEQKKMLDNEKRNPDTNSEDVKARLEHGTKNEINAVATLVGIILPMYFPRCCFVEEGCYKVTGSTKENLMVVSPDGSIRRVDRESDSTSVSPAIAAVEIKCPYPRDDTLPVHYGVPVYYVCQCLAEMVVLGTSRLLYLSYSAESTTVFEMSFDESLWNDIWSIVCVIFDKSVPAITKNTKQAATELKPRLQQFVEKNVVFLAEVPSLTAVDSGLCQTSPNSPFLSAWPRRNMDISEYNVTDSIVQNSISCKATTETCYNLMRRKAAEVMVWVLTNIDRNSKLEIPCSLPIAFGLKDYKLNSEAMRKATNYVIDKCTESGIHICSFATDGQWIQLMNRDSNGKPMTVYQFQKDVWNKVKAISKSSLATIIGNLNKVMDSSGNLDETLICVWQENGSLHARSKTLAFQKIKTCVEKTLWIVKSKSKANEVSISSENIGDEHDNMIDCNEMTQVPDDDEMLTSEMKGDTLHPNHLQSLYSTSTRQNNDEAVGDVPGLEVVPKSTLNNYEIHQQELLTTDMDDGDGIYSVNTDTFDDDNNPIMQADENGAQCYNTNESHDLLNTCTLSNILTSLKTNPRTCKKWINSTTEALENTLKTKSLREKLTHKELDIISENLLQCVTEIPISRVSWKKEKKIDYLTLLLSKRLKDMTKFKPRKAVKLKSPDSLSKICLKKIHSREVPKGVLNVAYASYTFPQELVSWQQSMSFKHDLKINDYEEEIPFWFSYPEKNASNGEFICKSIDCSHNYTHLRVRSCTTGIGNVTPDAWKAVAKSNETHLNLAMVEDLLDKQSVPNAQTNFSEEVEKWMRDHGFTDAANLTEIIRNWYEASDTPGLSAHERVKRLIRMRKLILNDVDFGRFPPSGRYFNKIPFVTFEGMLIDIDTKLQLHGIIGPYNIRSVGSLAAETTVGILQELSPSNTSSIKARDVPALVSNVVEVMTCKICTNRGFYMRTAKASGVYPVHETDAMDAKKPDCNEDNSSISHGGITLCDHPFDLPERKRVARKIRFGSVSGPSVPARGAQSVRQWHRKDETKILPSKRLGIEIDTSAL